MTDGARPVTAVELLQVDGDDLRLDRLVQLYQYEWTGLIPHAVGLDARFAQVDLAAYRDRDRHAAFLLVDGGDRRPLGFALIERDDDGCWHVEEFFVMVGERRRRLGADAARQVMATRPGPWSLTVRPENPGALAFWRAVLPGADERAEPGDDGVTRTRLSAVIGGA